MEETTRRPLPADYRAQYHIAGLHIDKKGFGTFLLAALLALAGTALVILFSKDFEDTVQRSLSVAFIVLVSLAWSKALYMWSIPNGRVFGYILGLVLGFGGLIGLGMVTYTWISYGTLAVANMLVAVFYAITEL